MDQALVSLASGHPLIDIDWTVLVQFGLFLLLYVVANQALRGSAEDWLVHPEDNQQILHALEVDSGLVFHHDAVAHVRVMDRYQPPSPRMWILQSQMPFFLEGESGKVSTETSYACFRVYLSEDTLGKPSEAFSDIYEWETDNASFRASQMQSARGFFLRVEKFPHRGR